MLDLDAQLPVLILLCLFAGAVVVPAIGFVRRSMVHGTAFAFLLCYLVLALRLFVNVLGGEALNYELGGWSPPIGIELRVDMLSALMIVLLAAVSVVVSIHARLSVRHELGDKETPFYSLLLIMLVGLSGMVLTGDLFNLYVFFEVSSLSGYSLMAIGSRKAPVSAYRYLLVGTVGASFYLIGVFYLYVLTGSLNMTDVSQRIGLMASNPALLLSIVFMVVGVGLKMALFPMHLWLPDAYHYASSTATAVIAPVMTKVSAYVLIRMLFFVYDSDLVRESVPASQLLTWLGAAGIVVGSLMAIAQKDAKRMLAYSSVAQVAYIAVGIGLGERYALIGAMLHIVNHATMKSCLFLVTANVSLRVGSHRIARYSGLGRKMPWTFLGFTVAALAMVGIPPTNGFFSKWYLVLGGIQSGAWVVVVVVLASGLLTGVYFFRLLTRVLTEAEKPLSGESAAEYEHIRDAPFTMCLPVVVLAAGILLLGLLNEWIVVEVLNRALPPGLG